MADLYTYRHANWRQFLQFHILSNSHLRARSHECEQQKDNQSQFSESGANKRNDLIAMEIMVVWRVSGCRWVLHHWPSSADPTKPLHPPPPNHPSHFFPQLLNYWPITAPPLKHVFAAGHCREPFKSGQKETAGSSARPKNLCVLSSLAFPNLTDKTASNMMLI